MTETETVLHVTRSKCCHPPPPTTGIPFVVIYLAENYWETLAPTRLSESAVDGHLTLEVETQQAEIRT